MEAASALAIQESPTPTLDPINQSSPDAQQRTGNGPVVLSLNGKRHIGVAFTPATASAAGKRRPATERKKQAEVLANTCYDLMVMLRSEMGLNQPKAEQNGAEVTQTPAAQANGLHPNGENGEKGCESDSQESARDRLKSAASVAVLLVRGWDTALERLRMLQGVPDPGCRRPGEPSPKVRKPTNRAPDSLACGPESK